MGRGTVAGDGRSKSVASHPSRTLRQGDHVYRQSKVSLQTPAKLRLRNHRLARSDFEDKSLLSVKNPYLGLCEILALFSHKPYQAQRVIPDPG